MCALVFDMRRFQPLWIVAGSAKDIQRIQETGLKESPDCIDLFYRAGYFVRESIRKLCLSKGRLGEFEGGQGLF